MMAPLPSIAIDHFESFKSKRVVTSFMACWMALDTSCRSILLTISKVFSGISLSLSDQIPPSPPKSQPIKLNGSPVFVKRKETVEMFRGSDSNFFGRKSPQRPELPRHFLDIGRLVALAAVGNRRQKRRVRLNQHAGPAE